MKTPLLLLALASARLLPAAESTGSPFLQDFEKRVSAYVELHKGVESKLPKLKSTRSGEKISHYQHEFAHAIRDARKAARQGDIFTPPVAAEFRRIIGLTMQADGRQITASLRHAEPVHLSLVVNDAYPSGVPLQSTPPDLLLNLPRLPMEVEYRVDGADLVLLDVRANLVVDLIPDVFS